MLIKYFFILAIIWWLVFFLVLPFGQEIPDKVEKGHADSAPKDPKLGIKSLITTVIAAILSYIILYYLQENGY